MKKVLVALAALALASPAFAQEKPQVGLGIGFNPQAVVVPTFEIYVPIQLAPALRIEPSVGVLTHDVPAGGVDRSDVTIGVGVFFTQKVAPPVDFYGGGRIKLNFASEDPGDSGTDFLIAAAAGAEYYFVPKFSLGLEAQLGFFSNSTPSGDDSGFFTNGIGFLRMYF